MSGVAEGIGRFPCSVFWLGKVKPTDGKPLISSAVDPRVQSPAVQRALCRLFGNLEPPGRSWWACREQRPLATQCSCASAFEHSTVIPCVTGLAVIAGGGALLLRASKDAPTGDPVILRGSPKDGEHLRMTARGVSILRPLVSARIQVGKTALKQVMRVGAGRVEALGVVLHGKTPACRRAGCRNWSRRTAKCGSALRRSGKRRLGPRRRPWFIEVISTLPVVSSLTG